MRNLIVLACPLGMGLMMWVMMRGNHDRSSPPQQQPPMTVAQQDELARLRAELEELRAEDKTRSTDATA